VRAAGEINLTRELAGRWEVIAREEPSGASMFPASAVTFVTWDGSTSLEGRTAVLLDVWWSLEPTDAFLPSTPWLADLEELLFGERTWVVPESVAATRIGRAHYRPPAVLFHTLVRHATSDLPASPYQQWAAEIHQVEPDVLLFETVDTERTGAPTARAWLRRAPKPEAGWDFAFELARENGSP
jgi:hypothetical protein